MERFRNRRAGGPGRLAEPPIGSAEAAEFGVVQRPPRTSPRPLLPPRGSTARLKNDGKPCRAGQENRSGFCRKALPFGRLRRPSPERQPSRETGTMRWDRRCSQLEKQIGPRVDATDCVQPRFSHSTSSGSRGGGSTGRRRPGCASDPPHRLRSASARGSARPSCGETPRVRWPELHGQPEPLYSGRRTPGGGSLAPHSRPPPPRDSGSFEPPPPGSGFFDRVPRRTPLRGK